MQKVTFSMCFIRCSGILNVCANTSTLAQENLKIRRKTILPLQLSECLIKISTPTSTKTMSSRNLYFMVS